MILSPCRISARAKSSAVHSGASSYSCGWMTWASTFPKLLPVRFLFSLIAFPHRNDVPRGTARRPHNHHHATLQEADRLPAGFTVVVARVLLLVDATREHLAGIFEIQASFR